MNFIPEIYRVSVIIPIDFDHIFQRGGYTGPPTRNGQNWDCWGMVYWLNPEWDFAEEFGALVRTSWECAGDMVQRMPYTIPQPSSFL